MSKQISQKHQNTKYKTMIMDRLGGVNKTSKKKNGSKINSIKTQCTPN
jgi:hypothetical protein